MAWARPLALKPTGPAAEQVGSFVTDRTQRTQYCSGRRRPATPRCCAGGGAVRHLRIHNALPASSVCRKRAVAPPHRVPPRGGLLRGPTLLFALLALLALLRLLRRLRLLRLDRRVEDARAAGGYLVQPRSRRSAAPALRRAPLPPQRMRCGHRVRRSRAWAHAAGARTPRRRRPSPPGPSAPS